VSLADPAAPVTLFETTLPARGIINRISAITGSAGAIYVAAGDAGLVSFDTSTFVAPYTLQAFPLASPTSAAVVPRGIVVAAEAGGLSLYSSCGSALTRVESFGTGISWTIRDANAGRIAASAGTALTVFDAAQTPTAIVSTGAFSKGLRGAVIVGNNVIALLDDRTVWSAVIGNPSFTPSKVDLGTAAPSFIARAGSAIVMAEFTIDGKTLLRYWGDGDLTKAPLTQTVDGAATSGVALSSNGIAAVSTFKGLITVDFAHGGVTSVVPGVPAGIAIQFSGTNILFLTSSRLLVFTPGSTTSSSFELSAAPISFARGDAPDPAWIVTSSGLTSYNRNGAPLPVASIPPSSNRYFDSMAADGELVVLLDGATVEKFRSSQSGLPQYLGRITLDPATFDIALSGTRLVALTNDLRVLAYGLDGSQSGSVQINEGGDASGLAVRNVGGAIHVAILKGCLSGTCEKKTLVFDPRNGLQQTASYNGGIVDAAVNGTTAWVLTDLPSELRRLDITDPYHPIIAASVAVTGNPTSLAYSASTNSLLLIGDKLVSYALPALTKVGELSSSYVADASGRVTYLDQAVRVTGGKCATLVGRTFQPQQFTVVGPETISVPQPLALPAAGKRVAVVNGDIWILTDYSLEIFSAKPSPKRKRPVS
jgi:hypothetical protein